MTGETGKQLEMELFEFVNDPKADADWLLRVLRRHRANPELERVEEDISVTTSVLMRLLQERNRLLLLAEAK